LNVTMLTETLVIPLVVVKLAGSPLLQRSGRDLKKISPKASFDRSGRGGQK
jgi:hypothetical protein